MMNKSPNFFCIGAQKAGTTSLYNILIQNPEIYLPRNKKEIHYFDYDRNYNKGLNWYFKKYFNNVKNEHAIGEITPSYSYFSHVPERIYNDLGSDVKFIFILRQPIDRAISHYSMMTSRKEEEFTFLEAIEYEEQRLNSNQIDSKKNYSYLNRGFYSKQLTNYYKFFDKDNILLLSFEKEIKENLKETIIKIESFLGVKHISYSNLHIASNASDSQFKYKNLFKIKSNLKNIFPFLPQKIKSKINSIFFKKLPFKKFKIEEKENQRLLKKYYTQDINKLNELTNCKFSYWLEYKSI